MLLSCMFELRNDITYIISLRYVIIVFLYLGNFTMNVFNCHFLKTDF